MTRRKPRNRPPESSGESSGAGERLQKVLAGAGIGSRRECEELIVEGRVEVDGKVTTELGTRVDPMQQEIRVDGVSLPRPRRVYYALNKPAGVVCTNEDPSGRVKAVDLIRSDQRLFTVGRLDRGSEGLILITNDGELANRLTHPRYGVEKRYIARVVGSPGLELFEKLRRGIHLAEGVARVSDIQVRKRTSRFVDLEIALREGRNREIRRILARVGHKVVQLKRIAIGSLRLGMLPVGESRQLTREEVVKLQQVGSESRKRQRSPTRSPSRRPPVVRDAPSKPQREFKATAERKPQRPTAPLELDELEVRDWPVSGKQGSVLAFEDADSPVSKPFRKKQRRSR